MGRFNDAAPLPSRWCGVRVVRRWSPGPLRARGASWRVRGPRHGASCWAWSRFQIRGASVFATTVDRVPTPAKPWFRIEGEPRVPGRWPSRRGNLAAGVHGPRHSV